MLKRRVHSGNIFRLGSWFGAAGAPGIILFSGERRSAQSELIVTNQRFALIFNWKNARRDFGDIEERLFAYEVQFRLLRLILFSIMGLLLVLARRLDWILFHLETVGTMIMISVQILQNNGPGITSSEG